MTIQVTSIRRRIVVKNQIYLYINKTWLKLPPKLNGHALVIKSFTHKLMWLHTLKPQVIFNRLLRLSVETRFERTIYSDFPFIKTCHKKSVIWKWPTGYEEYSNQVLTFRFPNGIKGIWSCCWRHPVSSSGFHQPLVLGASGGTVIKTIQLFKANALVSYGCGCKLVPACWWRHHPSSDQQKHRLLFHIEI